MCTLQFLSKIMKFCLELWCNGGGWLDQSGLQSSFHTSERCRIAIASAFSFFVIFFSLCIPHTSCEHAPLFMWAQDKPGLVFPIVCVKVEPLQRCSERSVNPVLRPLCVCLLSVRSPWSSSFGILPSDILLTCSSALWSTIPTTMFKCWEFYLEQNLCV